MVHGVALLHKTVPSPDASAAWITIVWLAAVSAAVWWQKLKFTSSLAALLSTGMPVVPNSSAPSTSTFTRMLPPNEVFAPAPTKHTCTGLAAVIRVIDMPVMVAREVVSATSPAVRWARAALVPPTSAEIVVHVGRDPP